MACIEAWWVTAAFAAISCFGGTSPTGRNWSLLAGTRKNRQSMRTDVFFEATPSESFVEGTPFRQRAEIGDVVAQIERRLGCASDESSAYSPTPMFGLDPHGSHPRSVLRALVQVAGDNERRSEISPPHHGPRDRRAARCRSAFPACGLSRVPADGLLLATRPSKSGPRPLRRRQADHEGQRWRKAAAVVGT